MIIQSRGQEVVTPRTMPVNKRNESSLFVGLRQWLILPTPQGAVKHCDQIGPDTPCSLTGSVTKIFLRFLRG